MDARRGDRVVLTRDFYPEIYSFAIRKGTKGTVTEVKESAFFGKSFFVKFEGQNEAIEINYNAFMDACSLI